MHSIKYFRQIPGSQYILTILLAVIFSAVSSYSSSAQISYSFYAVYHRLLDSNTQTFKPESILFSDDGKIIAVAGTDPLYDEPVLCTLNSDGTNLQTINLPEEISSINSYAIDSAGSVIYLYSCPVIYRIENGEVTPIFDLEEETQYYDCSRIITNGHGNYVYIIIGGAYNEGVVCRINGDGTGYQLAVYYKDVIRDGGYGGGLGSGDFSVCHDGSKMAFTMDGFNDEKGFHNKAELFLRDEEGYHQLTNESEVTNKGNVRISGDGSKIVFYSTGTESKWYSVNSDGSGRIPIADHGFNFTGMDLSYDGSMMIHGEGSANGGCLVATDGSWVRELFSSTYPWNLQFDFLWSEMKMSDDGKKVAFLFDATENGKRTYSLYVGLFNNPFAVQNAPLIEHISMIPPVIPDVPDAQLILSTRISDPQGLDDLKYLACNELNNGRKEYSSQVPVYFNWDPNDGGEWPDEEAGDGLFNTEGETRSIVDQFTEAGIRIGVVDQSWTVVIADTVFNIETVPAPGQVELIAPSLNETNVDTSLWFSWHLVDYAVKYHLQIGRDAGFDHVFLSKEEVRDTSLLVSELEHGNLYYWRVRAHNSVEYGTWSEVRSFATHGAVHVDEYRSVRTGRLSVHPNPVALDKPLHISVQDHPVTCLEIYNCSGRLLFREEYEGQQEEMLLHVGRFTRIGGIYLFRIISPAGTYCRKVRVMNR